MDRCSPSASRSTSGAAAAIVLRAVPARERRDVLARRCGGAGAAPISTSGSGSATGLVAFVAGFRFFGHYWLQVLPPLCLLAGLGAASCRPRLRRRARRRGRGPRRRGLDHRPRQPAATSAPGVVPPLAATSTRTLEPATSSRCGAARPTSTGGRVALPGGALDQYRLRRRQDRRPARRCRRAWPTPPPVRSRPSCARYVRIPRRCSSTPRPATCAATTSTRCPGSPRSSASSTPTTVRVTPRRHDLPVPARGLRTGALTVWPCSHPGAGTQHMRASTMRDGGGDGRTDTRPSRGRGRSRRGHAAR